MVVLTADSLANVPASFPRERHAQEYSVRTYYTDASLAALLESTGFSVAVCRSILRSAEACGELAESIDRTKGLGPIAAERRRHRLELAEQAATGDSGLFVLAVARKDA
jgi:hypothetical protein